MHYLITGTNGASKTLNTIKWVYERALKEGRPVYYNGRFTIKPDGPLKNWKIHEFKDWQSLPDGSIYICDEAHNDLPKRPTNSAVPDYVMMLAEHRRRGFDFYFLTQHPSNIDSFLTKLIGPPGWHRHLKRVAGAEMVSVLEWPAVELQCEKMGKGKSADFSLQAFPKDVYDWYESATIHTVKKHIPKKVKLFIIYVLLFIVVVVGTIWWINRNFGTDAVKKKGNGGQETETVTAKKAGSSGGSGDGGSRASSGMSPAEYAIAREPRVRGLPHTASAYDEVTKPTIAPYPAACVDMKSKGCSCYTQQGTLMAVPAEICLQIVKRGFFVDWQLPPPSQPVPQPAARESVRVAQAEPEIRPVPQPQPQPAPLGYLESLAMRNAQVRSTLQQ